MAGTGFSLSFKGGKKPLPRVSVQVKDKEEKLDFVTGISGTSLNSVEPKQKEGPKVIPKIENTFQVGVGKTASKAQKARERRFLPDESLEAQKANEDRFELADDTAMAQASHIKYGLTQLRPADEPEGGAAVAGGGGGGAGESSALSQLMSRVDTETQQMKEDLEKLPETASLDAYEAMPIEAFGAAMLRGMGWKEGMNVGRNQKAEIKAVEYVPRPGRLGLGAAPAAPGAAKEKKYIKPGESREAKPDLVVARDADGRQRNVRSLDEKLVQRELPGAHPGKVMWIASGEHSGFLCSVMDVRHGPATAEVRLKPSEETVTVALRDLVERWERDGGVRKEQERRGRDKEDRRHREKEDRRDRDREKEERREKDHHREKKSKEKDRRRDRDRDGRSSKRSRRSRSPAEEQPQPQRRRSPPWLAADIRVRIVDKRLGAGKLYLKKGTVTDVHGPRCCDVQVDGTGETVQGVEQEQLETLVPKGEGVRVLVLAGEHRWQKARLLQRNAETGMAAVQFTGDFAVHKLPLDDISEYVGPLQDDE